MGWLKKALKGVNKAVNKVGTVASKAVGGASNLIGKVSKIPGVNMIPGMGVVSNIANTAGKIAGGVGNIIASGKSPRGSSPPAMSSPVLEMAPSSVQALSASASGSVGNTRFSVNTGNNIQTSVKPKNWFQKNKIVVFISSGVVALVGVLLLVFRKKSTTSYRRR